MSQVLSVSSECVPLVKTGGLADVAGALPAAVAEHGVDMRTLLPGYPAVMQQLPDDAPVVAEFGDLFGGPGRVRQGRLGKQVLYVVQAPHLYERGGGLYLDQDGTDWPDNAERFAALSWTAAHIGAQGLATFQPDVLHLHDWQAALAPTYLRQMAGPKRVGTLLTIHNVAFQGRAPAHKLDALRLLSSEFRQEGFEYYGDISALKAGLVHADRISTVSPTYAAELLRPEFGMGLQGVLNNRRDDLHGILNGIDRSAWHPPYKTAAGKRRHKKALRKELGLPDSDGPLCVVVSRLTWQKGLDMLLQALPALLDGGGQLALLGNGEHELEHAFVQAADSSEHIAVHIGYTEAQARRFLAGGDAILVPSRFEPCGLTQLYGLHYGTLPLVALTGGLADTVIPANTAGQLAGVATGFQFHPIEASALERALRDMCTLYKRPDVWRAMQKNAMRHPVDWRESANAYATLYKELTHP